MISLTPPDRGDDWVGLSDTMLPFGAVADWAVLPSCGAVVCFSGSSRDHSGVVGDADRRDGVTVLEYEAYDDHVVPRLVAIAGEVRLRWPDAGRVALLHRVGEVPVGQSSVVVVVSAPHRDEAFAAARFAIDAVKVTVPIWKREVWDGGSAWGLDAHDIEAVERVPARGEVADRDARAESRGPS